jgi:multiple sugar transport system ATP-binding protein
VSLGIEDGECLVIVGPSGSGKTTVLRLIAGLELPTAGDVSIDGKVLNDIPAGRRDVAMIFQDPALYPDMSVQENLEFGLRLRRCSRQEMARRVGEAAEVLGLTGYLQGQPGQLSGGQRQRVAIGRAMVRRTPVLLLDEPLANLDPPLRAQLRQDLRNVQAKFGTTMVYVTHDHLEAVLMADRVAVLRAGGLQQVQAPRLVYRRPANLFVAGFFGFPSINLFQGRFVERDAGVFFEATSGSSPISRDNGQTGIGAPEPGSGGVGSRVFCFPMVASWKNAAERYSNQTIVLAIRPEQIRPVSSRASQPVLASVRARIELVHNAGADAFVKACSNGSSFYARATENEIPSQGQECFFTFDTEAACLFDATTGNALEFL